MRVFTSADIGARDEQQDAYAIAPEAGGEREPDGESIATVVLADGMGGHAGGAEASRAAVHAFIEELEAPVTRDTITSAIGWACREVAANSVGATTLVMAHVAPPAAPSSPRAGIIAWIGDSRAYLVREGEAELLTEDHAAADGGLYRWLPDEGLADFVELTLNAGDRLVLCSDGVSDVLEEHEFAQCETSDGDPAEWLVAQALEAGASDNCTVIVCVV